MLLLTRSDIRKVINMKEAIEAVEGAYKAYSAGRTQVPPRVHIDVPAKNAVALFMPGFVESQDALGVKMVAVFPHNTGLPVINSIVLLMDTETGMPVVAMEGGYLTALRTGAASGVATRYLAREDASSVAIIGTGVQAKTQLEAVCNVRNIERVKVFDINRLKAQDFTNEMRNILESFNLEFAVASSAAEVIEDTDIICAATTSKKPVFPAGGLKPGVHINAVGAFTPEMQEIGEDVLAVVDKVCVDSLEAAMDEAGDLIIPINKGIFCREDIYGEIGQVAAGLLKPREKAEEITMFKTVGIAALDVSVGRRILLRARELGVGREFDFTV